MSMTRGEAYSILELPVGADPDTIRNSYKRLALKWHPNKHRGINYNEALWKFQQFSKAYKRLITDADVTAMTPTEMYELYKQTFQKQSTSVVVTTSFSNGCEMTSNDIKREDGDHRDSRNMHHNQVSIKNECERLTEKDDEQSKTERRKNKKKQQKEKKKLEKEFGDFNKSEVDKRNSNSIQADSENEKACMRNEESSESEAETLDSLDPLVLQSRQLAVQGNEMANKGQYNNAISLFTEAIRLDPKDYRFFGNRSYCYDRLTQYDKCLQDADCAISLAQFWPKGYFRKGRALAGLKQYPGAEVAFLQVLKLDENCEDARHELTRIRTQQLTDMGFSQQQAEHALLQNETVQKALDSLLAGLAGNTIFGRTPSDLNNCRNPFDRRQTSSPFSHVTSSAAGHVTIPQLGQVEVNSRGSSSSLSRLMCSPVSYQTAAATPAAPLLPPFASSSETDRSKQATAGNHGKTRQRGSDKTQNTSTASIKMDPANPEGLTALWVGNVLPEVSEKKLVQMFSKYGTVTSVRCLPDKFCAFVNFKDKESAARAMKGLQGAECCRQKLLIKFPDNPITNNVVAKKATEPATKATTTTVATNVSKKSNQTGTKKQTISSQRRI